MPHLFAIALCLLLLVAAIVLVAMEFKRSRKGPQLKSDDFLRGTAELQQRKAAPKEVRPVHNEW